MTDESKDMIRLQLAMAFGQGAGFMLATPEAIKFLLEQHDSVIERAGRDWKRSKFALVELVRVLGQVAAAKAAADTAWEIDRQHVETSLPVAFGPCPC